MSSVIVTAPAKINLTLDVLARRADGYHDIRSVMQTISLHDTLEVTHTPDAPDVRLTVMGDEADGVPADASNIVHRAAVRLQKVAAARGTLPGGQSGLAITLTKRIPSQAGLGGGSSDAAATLRAVDGLFGLGLSLPRLTEIGAALGADVPFFLTGGTALVEGLGERVTPLLPLSPKWWVVIVKPPVGVSTARAYAALDAIPGRVPGSVTDEWADYPLHNGPLGNDFHDVVLGLYPEIARGYDVLKSPRGFPALKAPHGVPDWTGSNRGPILCGSGAALFCRARNSESAGRIAAEVRDLQVGRVWVAHTYGGDTA